MQTFSQMQNVVLLANNCNGYKHTKYAKYIVSNLLKYHKEEYIMFKEEVTLKMKQVFMQDQQVYSSKKLLGLHLT